MISICFWKESHGRTYSDELVGDNLDTDQLSDLKKIVLTDTQQPCDWVEEVSEQKLNGQVEWIRNNSAILEDGSFARSNVEILSPPGQETVDEGKKGENDKERGSNHACNLKTQPTTVGKSVESVLWLLLRLINGWDDNAT